MAGGVQSPSMEIQLTGSPVSVSPLSSESGETGGWDVSGWGSGPSSGLEQAESRTKAVLRMTLIGPPSCHFDQQVIPSCFLRPSGPASVGVIS